MATQRARGRPRGTTRGRTARKKTVTVPRKKGRPIGTSTAPAVAPPPTHIRNGKYTTYTRYSPYVTKDGQTVYHKHSYTILNKAYEREEQAKITQLKKEKAKKIKRALSLSNVDSLSIDHLDKITALLPPSVRCH